MQLNFKDSAIIIGKTKDNNILIDGHFHTKYSQIEIRTIIMM